MATVRSSPRSPATFHLGTCRTVFFECVGALASVRLAAATAAALALLGLGGILIPQLPEAARSDPGATADWLANQRQSVGPTADWLYRLGLYDVFHSIWMAAGFGLLGLSVIACTARRFGPIWRNVTRPVKNVPATFLDNAKSSVFSTGAVDPAALERELRRRHFRVERWREGEAAWLFADRYPWAQLATFVSHAALVLLMIGVLVTHFGGFTSRLFIAEGSSEPVFPIGHTPNMNVKLDGATASFDPSGRPLDNRSQIAVTTNGNPAKTCAMTASQPCYYSGYRLRQAVFYPFGADIEVTDLSKGIVVYRKPVALTASQRVPRLVVSDASGAVVLDQALSFAGSVGGVDGTLVNVPGLDQPVWVGLSGSANAPQLIAFETGGIASPFRLTLSLHEATWAGGLRFEFAGVEAAPAAEVPDLPVASTTNVPSVPMAEFVPAGGRTPGSLVLLLSGIGDGTITLREGERAIVGNLEYRFVRQVPFVGVEVKKDRGEPLIWIGSAMLVLGLCATLWIPRRRFWAMVKGDGLRMAGMAPRFADLPLEMENLAAAAARSATEASAPKSLS